MVQHPKSEKRDKEFLERFTNSRECTALSEILDRELFAVGKAIGQNHVDANSLTRLSGYSQAIQDVLVLLGTR